MKEIFVFPFIGKLCKRIEELSEMSQHHLLVSFVQYLTSL